MPHSSNNLRELSLSLPLFWIAIFSMLIFSIFFPEQTVQQQKTRLICSDGFMILVVTIQHFHLA
jgi:ABC-type antimicrobial peptide transport system permease subunit